jgi:hypothetical protein
MYHTYENPSSGAKLFMRKNGWTHGHDEANSHFAQLCERAKNQPVNAVQ